MSKKDSNLDKLAMKPGEYPVGKPFHYCPTNDCGECHGCTTGKELGALVRPDLNDEEFEAHLQDTFLDDDRLRVAGGLNLMDKNGHPTCFNGYCGKCSECFRLLRESVNQAADGSLFKPGLTSRRPLPLIGFPAGCVLRDIVALLCFRTSWPLAVCRFFISGLVMRSANKAL